MAVSELPRGPQAGAAFGPREGGEAGVATRRRIADVALALIAEHGFAATSTREIAEHLGFTKAALYYHFRTKDDLLAAIVEPAVADLSALLDRGEPHPSPAVRRHLVAGYVDLVVDHRDLIRVLSNDPSARRDTVVATAQPLYWRLTQHLAGVAAPDTAQRTRVRAALGAVHAALLRSPEGDDPEVVRATALVAACGALGIPAA